MWSKILSYFAYLVLIIGLAIECFFRDGLGSDSISSYGLDATIKILLNSWYVFLVTGILLAVSKYLVRSKNT